MEKTIYRGNYLLVREFLEKDNNNISEKSKKKYYFDIRHLLYWAGDTPLAEAQKISPSYPEYVAKLPSPRKSFLTAETQKKLINIAKKFFKWAKLEHPNQFKPIKASWIDGMHPLKKTVHPAEHGNIDIQLLENDTEEFGNPSLKFVTLDEVIALTKIPRRDNDLALWRDCAMVALLFLSGARANAAVTMPIGAISIDKMQIRQWPALGVHTKNGKTATTYLHPIPELIEVVQSWDNYVRQNLPIASPWYAPIDSKWGEQKFSDAPIGKNRGNGLNKRLRILFKEAGLQYKSAHAFRHGHALYGLLHCETMADYKALSQNLMHGSLEITDSVYVHLVQKELRKRILGFKPGSEKHQNIIDFLISLSREEKAEAIKILAGELAK